MATYHQYSEIVAAYGNRLPPPPSAAAQSTPRLAMALLYAAVGVTLGTLTGAGLGAVSLHTGAVMAASHMRLASFQAARARIHPIANAGQSPVIQNHADVTAAHAVQLSAVPTLPAKLVILAPHSAPVKVALVAPVQVKAPIVHRHVLLAKLPPAPATSPATIPATSPAISDARLHTQAIAPLRLQAIAPLASQAIQAGRAGQAVQAETAPPPSAPIVAFTPAPSDAASIDSSFKAPLLYREGDATVVNYDATGNTIETDDGTTFAVGPTVSESNATPWGEYHANVHYRCDQNGNCTLSRTGVIALNARTI